LLGKFRCPDLVGRVNLERALANLEFPAIFAEDILHELDDIARHGILPPDGLCCLRLVSSRLIDEDQASQLRRKVVCRARGGKITGRGDSSSDVRQACCRDGNKLRDPAADPRRRGAQQ
jgi:hypothetical protein